MRFPWVLTEFLEFILLVFLPAPATSQTVKTQRRITEAISEYSLVMLHKAHDLVGSRWEAVTERSI